ncbi:MAG: hypothetical protein FDZ69_10350 [Deltaproteobacteria bacterium]|nr:MAG: hypothetical protein FDZ69_10350 [Deltaproteobacteria bacterium]
MNRSMPHGRQGHPLLVVALLLLLPVTAQGGMGFMPPPPAPAPLVVTPGPMKTPMRIAATGPGRFVATDYQDGTVYEIKAATPDQPVALFKVQGQPLAVEPNGTQFLVGNDSTGAIEIYRRDGKKLKTFTAGGEIKPSDIACDSRMRLVFAVDGLNREVKVFSVGGTLVRSFGAAAPLSNPMGIAIDPRTQQVFVSDYGDPRVGIAASINVFTYKGALLRRITGSFSRPQGLALDSRNLYVVDAMLGQILVFNRTTFASAGALGGFGTAAGKLLLPMDLSRDPATGKLFVTNSRMGRVAAFAPPSP